MAQRFIPLCETFSVSPQISARDVADAAAQGFTLIVNNRPDGEMVGQPTAAEIGTAAEQAGLHYIHIPVDQRGISEGHIEALKAALKDHGQKTLAFCRTGTRSTVLRAYLKASEGAKADDIIAEAAAAGYDLRAHRPALDALGS